MSGFLFRPLLPQGLVQPAPFLSSAAQGRLNSYVAQLPEVFGSRNVTLHGLRNGCAISLAMAGADLQTIMDHVGWKTPSMARHYIKLNQVLGSGGAGDLLSSMPISIADSYRRQNDLLGFSQAF
jgi:integrase